MASGRTKNTRNQSEMKLQSTGATTGYEAPLWQMADALRGSMDAAAYKHVVLGRRGGGSGADRIVEAIRPGVRRGYAPYPIIAKFHGCLHQNRSLNTPAYGRYTEHPLDDIMIDIWTVINSCSPVYWLQSSEKR